MESILQGLTFEACHVYPHDVITVDWTFQEQLDKLQKVFQ
jgi:hypothetical protein